MSFDSEQDPDPEEGLDPADYIAACDLPEDTDLELAQQNALANTWRLFILYYGCRGELQAIATAFKTLLGTQNHAILALIFRRPSDQHTALFYQLLTACIPTSLWIKTISFLLSQDDSLSQILLSSLNSDEWRSGLSFVQTLHMSSRSALPPNLVIQLIQHSPEYKQEGFSWREQLSRYVQPAQIPSYIPLLSYHSAIQLFMDTMGQIVDNKALLTQLVRTRSNSLIAAMLAAAITKQARATSAINADLFQEVILIEEPSSPQLKIILNLQAIRNELLARQTDKYQAKPDDKMYKAKAESCSALRMYLLKVIKAYSDPHQASVKAKKAATETLQYINNAPNKKNGELIFEGLPTAFMNLQRDKIERLLKPLAGTVSSASVTRTSPLRSRSAPQFKKWQTVRFL